MTTEQKKINKNARPFEIEMKEGVHFYFEKGFMVFTETYLKHRGYCCGNNCRHCPYKKKK